jgi:NADPH2:quinone reductase
VAAVVADAPRIGVVGEASRSDAAARAGWNHVVTTGAGPAAVRELLPEGVDAVLDPTGTVNLDFDLEVAAPGARVVLFGNPAGGAPPPLPPVGRLIGGNVGLFGFSISSLRRTRPTAVAAALQRSLALLAIGAVALDVTVVTGLDAVPDVHDALASRRGTGKYVARLT